jgi:hypothetical protein
MISSSNQRYLTLPAGTVIRVSHVLFDHVGMLSDRYVCGERGVISFSSKAGGMAEEPFSVFAAGKEVMVDGYLGTLPPESVMQRARSKASQEYRVLGFNCEHFIRYAHGLQIESPQLQFWVAASATAIAVALLARTGKGKAK